MNLDDLTIECRDINLNRMGIIRPGDLNLKAEILFNNVGNWTLNLPPEHPMGPLMRSPGSGIIVYGPTDVLFSGPTTDAGYSASASDPYGTLVIQGVTDDVILSDAVAYPNPAADAMSQGTVEFDKQTSVKVETLMHHYVKANIGPSAPAARRGKLASKLIMGTDGARGPAISKSVRFDQIGPLLAEIAAVGNLGFRVVQIGANLVFQTYLVTDRTKDIRLDLWNNTLSSQDLSLTGPTATYIIVAGSDSGQRQTWLAKTNPTAQQGEADWGRRIERYVNQSKSDDPAEYAQGADEVLVTEGITQANVALTPMDDTTMRFGHDWNLGDLVSTVTDIAEYAAPVSKIVLTVDPSGTRVGAILGDPSKTSLGYSLTTAISSTARRLAALERSA